VRSGGEIVASLLNPAAVALPVSLAAAHRPPDRNLSAPPALPPGLRRMRAAMNLFKLRFDFSGRIDRATYWRALAICFGLLFILGFIAGGVGLALYGHGHIDLAIPSLILALIVGVPMTVGRLHDRGKSGWWLLVFCVLPAVLGYFEDADGEILSLFLFYARLALLIWGFVELGCLRGAAGPNKFGPDPLAD
jgi:uncharacterized membrane protein YhaH (DUF805 family)